MKIYLVLSQLLYLLCVLPWMAVWGMSFMSFDQGYSGYAVAFVTGIGIYPIAVIACSIIAWKLHRRRARTAVAVNSIPLLWILAIGIPVFILN